MRLFFLWLLLCSVAVGVVHGATPTVRLQVVQNPKEDGTARGKILAIASSSGHNGIILNVTIGGTAVPGQDYTLRGDFIMPPGNLMAPISITAVNDDAFDENKTITFTLKDPLPDVPGIYTPGATTVATVQIIEDDGVPPGSPTSPAANGDVPSNGTIRLSWVDPTEPFDDIFIQRSTDESDWTTINLTGIAAGTETYDDTTPDTGVTYYYRIRGDNSFGEGDYSTTVSASATVQAPTVAASSLTATVTSPTTIDLSWTPSTDSITEQRPRIDAADVGVSLAPTLTTWQSTNLISDTLYAFVIRSTNSAGHIDSSSVNATTWKDSLTVPGSFVTSGISVSQLTNSWTLTTTTNDNVLFQYSTSADYSSPTQVSLAGNATSYVLGSLAAGTTYYTRISTTNEVLVLQGPWATSSGTTTIQAPDAPTLALQPDSQTSLVASWTDESAQDYQIDYWRTGGDTTNTVSAIATRSYQITGLSASTDYSARVRGRAASGLYGDYSSTVTAMTPGSVGLSATANGLTVSLLANTVSGATNYVFQRRDSVSGQWVQIASTNSTSLSDSDSLARLYIPMYDDPPSTFTSAVLAATGSKVGTVIINPASGPGSSAQANYTTFIDSAHSAGITNVIGYVSTARGERLTSLVKGDVDSYYSFYPAIDGIFFDEGGFHNSSGAPIGGGTAFGSLAESIAYYEDLRDYVVAKDASDNISFNNGQYPLSYMDSSYVFNDHTPVNIYESQISIWLTQVKPSHYDDYPPARLSALAETVDGTVKEFFEHAKKVINIGNLYVGSSVNAWGEIPETWGEQVQRIDQLAENHTYYYRVKAQFSDGTSETQWSAATSVTTGNDDTPPPANVAPTVALTAPADASTVAEGASVTISATASDSDGTVTSVQFIANSVVVGTDTTSPYAVSWVAMPGTVILEARATDNDGAVTTSTSRALNVTPSVSNPLPTVSIDSPLAGAVYSAGDTVTVIVSGSDDDFIARVNFYSGTTLLEADTAPDSSGNWRMEWSNIGAGSYVIVAEAVDSEGATATDSVSITVNAVTPPPTPTPGIAANWYISATGGSSLSTAGTLADPFDLHYATGSSAAGGRVLPGQVLDLTPGGHDVGEAGWDPQTIGTSSEKVTIRAYNDQWGGSWVHNNGWTQGGRSSAPPLFSPQDNYIVRNIRFFCSNPDNETFQLKGDKTTDELPRSDVAIEGDSVEIIHCIFHDVRGGLTHYGSKPLAGYVYGNLILNTGYMSSARGSSFPGYGQNMYVQNRASSVADAVTIEANWFLGSTDQYAFQFQGTSNSLANYIYFRDNYISSGETIWGWTQDLNGTVIDGNMFFDSRFRFSLRDAHTTSGTVIEDNYVYYMRLHYDHTDAAFRSLSDRPDYAAGGLLRNGGDYTFNRNTIIRDTRLHGASGNITQTQDPFELVNVSDANLYGENNSFIGRNSFEVNGTDVPFSTFNGYLDGPGNTHTTTYPSVNKIFVLPSKHQAKRARVIIYNYEDASSDTVDFSSFLDVGDTWSAYWVWDIQNSINPNTSIVAPVPVQTGTYTGSDVTLSWSGFATGRKAGMATIENTGFYGPLDRHSRQAAYIIIGAAP